MNPEKISKFIYELRTEKKLSQYQLADMIPISRQAVSKWERGQTIPDSSTLVRLSEIFEVTINELLKGERLKDNSIQELETTTLNIVDESNRKTRKIRKIILTSTITIILLLLGFLSYYFINSYNTIKVYTISGKSNNFDIHEGLFITAKQKTYMKIGDLIPISDVEINNVRLYYKKGKEEKIVFKDTDYKKTIMDLYGYQEYFPEEDLNSIIKNSYLEITYNETEKETIKLVFLRDFVNDFLLFIKNDKVITEKSTPITEDSTIKEAINSIKKNGRFENSAYILELMEEENIIRFYYYEETSQIVMRINNEIIWSVIIDSQIYSCYKITDSKQESRSVNNKCLERIREDINKYLLNEG